MRIHIRINLDVNATALERQEMEIMGENQVPTRAKSFAETQKTPKWAKAFRPLLKQDVAPSKQEYQAIVGALSLGDELMDDYIAWMFASNPKVAKQKYDQALHHGIESVENCPEQLRKIFAHFDNTPRWLDRELINDAIAFIHSAGNDGVHVLRDAALMGGYLLPGFNHALVLTGALNQDASKRFAETAKWWMDCTEYGGLERFGAGFKSTLHVRLIHGLVRRSLTANPEWDTGQWGTPISQIDMAATNLAFGLVFLLGLRALGIFPTPHESRSVLHLWKYAGWLMGVDERWLVDNERDGLVLLYRTQLTQSEADWTSQALGKALSLEPLDREYPHFSHLRRQFAYQQHLSISRYFIGRKNMEKLGLSKRVLPWYPLFATPFNALTYTVQRLVPTLKRAQQKRGRQAQRDYMTTFGEKGKTTLQPDKNHPAHV